MLRFVVLLLTLGFAHTSFSQVVAKVGNENITKSDFQKSYQEAVKNSLKASRPPTKAEHLEDMVRYRLGLQEANNTNLKENPLVKKALELELYKGLLETKLGKSVDKIKVSDSEMKSYYSKNPQIRSSNILIQFPAGATSTQIAEAKSRADKIYADVKTGKRKWEEYVQMYSDDAVSKSIGGDIGYHTADSIYPTYYNALKKMQSGQVSSPVQGLYGFFIIKKTDQLSYAQANKNLIKLSIFNLKRFALLNKYFDQLKKKYKVSTNKDLL